MLHFCLCLSVVTISRPSDSLFSTWTLLPAGGESSLTLRHRAAVVSERAPLRVSIELDAVALDGNRRAGDAPEEIVALPLPPPLPLPGMSEEGSFDVLLCDETMRVTRGGRGGKTLRIFERE